MAGSAVSDRNQTTPPTQTLPLYVGLGLVLLVIALTAGLRLFLPKAVIFEPRLLVTVLNSIIFLFYGSIAFVAIKGYLMSGAPNILFLGAGVLAYGLGTIVSGWALPLAGPNVSVTIHNTSALLASILQVVGVVMSMRAVSLWTGMSKKKKAAYLYLAASLVVTFIAVLSSTGHFPTYFIQGVGPTPLREGVLAIALVLFGLSSFYFLAQYYWTRQPFLYWYGLGLSLIMLCLTAIFLQTVVGSPIGWVGRSAQYLAGIYFLIAVVSVLRSGRTQKISLDESVAELFRKSEQKISSILASITDCHYELDRNWCFIRINNQALVYFGKKREEFIGQSYWDVLPAAEGSILAAHFRKAISEGTSVHFEAQLAVVPDTWAEIHVYPTEERGISVFFRDVTERRRAEEALRESEATLLGILNAATESIWLISVDGVVLMGNQTALMRVGRSAETVIGRAMHEFLPEELARSRQARLREVAQSGQTLRFEDERAGICFENIYYPVIGTDGRVNRVVVFGLDITERKLREARITRLTGLYSILSRVNEAIVRTRDQGVLYEEVCRIIAEEGVFPLVWIGEVKGRRVVPVASCGSAADYLSEIRVEVDGVLGHGPTGTCVREDRTVVNDDFDTNAASAPWREPALRRGFRSSAAFPLHCQGKVAAALTLYATRPGDFDGEQVDLLQALTADVSYALDATEQEKLRTRAETDLEHSLKRFELLAYTASELLQSLDPQKLVNSLCREVMEHLGCHAFFNFLAVEEAGRLKLNAYAGISEEEAQKIAWLDYGVAVCGCAAQDGCRIVAEHIPTTPDSRTELVKSYGIKAYACHPLFGLEGKVMGTLSFGACDREIFSDNDLSLMKAVADQVSVAMIRMRSEETMKMARDDLERRVEERTDSLRRQAELLELAYNAVVVRDLDGRIAFWNTRAEELYGWTKAEAFGNVTHTFLKTQFPVPFDEYVGMLIKEGRWEGEVLHTTKDGRQITVLSRQAVQRDKNENPLAVLEINLDITESKHLEAQLRQAQKMEALGTLSSGIAHDFNNILAAMIGFTELTKDHLPMGSRDEHHLQRVLEAGLRGRELVRQMLTFSRHSEQKKKPLQLSSIVKETVKLVRATTPMTISIRVNALSESGPILGDPVQIQQVLMNLCTNASHAMQEKGGVLDIELSDFSVSPSNGNPRGIEPGLYMKLVVRDTGSGIPPDIMDKIFDPFFTTKGLGEGTGLGLSVVHGIVTQSNGYVTVESEPGRGSIFTVYFPKVTGKPTSDTASDDPPPAGYERILFIDDEEALVEMGEEILAELGYDVTSKTNSREALALLRIDPSRFDLVITDQTMPDMTGIELAKEILALRSDMPVIMCTGFSRLVDTDKAKAAGIKAFTMKPVTKREIARTIRSVLDK